MDLTRMLAPWRRLASPDNVGSSAYHDALPAASGAVASARRVAAVALAAMSFAAVLVVPFLLLDPDIYYRDDIQLWPKLQLLRKGAATFDVGVLGTSRIINGFDPEVAERGASERGCSLRFANLGLTAMTWGDAWAIAAATNAIGQKPRLLLQETTLLVTSQTIQTARSIWGERIHTLPANIGSTLAFDHWNRSFRIVAVSLLNELPTGALARLLIRPPATSRAAKRKAADRRGYVPIMLQAGEKNVRHVRFVAQFAGKNLAQHVDKGMAAERARKRRRSQRQAQFAENFVGQMADRADVRVLALVPPNLNPHAFAYASLARAEARSQRLEYPPDRLPELYASMDLWFDENHVNESGTEIFSLALGRDVCDLTKHGER